MDFAANKIILDEEWSQLFCVCEYRTVIYGIGFGKSGVRMRRRIGWGKMMIDAMPIKASANGATLVLPLIVNQTFTKDEGCGRRGWRIAFVWLEDCS